jgi:mRNA-degrading endonuclease RelE of RelBE toxin-antitoxin system
MRAEIIYTKNARQNLLSLDKQTARKIALKIKFFGEQTNPLKYAKKLNPPFHDLYRFRIGKHRAIFEIGKKGRLVLLVILKIDLQKDIYD